MSDKGYAHPELLTQSHWLAEHINDSGVRLIDCGQIEAYNRAHIPGAVGLPVHHYIKDPDDFRFVKPPDQFAVLMGQLGVGDDTLVVTYDERNSLDATRMWWVLNHYGHANVKVLDGGWKSWLRERRPITLEPLVPAPATFTPVVRDELICDAPGLMQRVGSTSTVILDVRSDEEWTGENDRGNRRRGHVPGAKHIEYLDFVSQDDGKFLPADALWAMLACAGIHPEAEVVTY